MPEGVKESEKLSLEVAEEYKNVFSKFKTAIGRERIKKINQEYVK